MAYDDHLEPAFLREAESDSFERERVVTNRASMSAIALLSASNFTSREQLLDALKNQVRILEGEISLAKLIQK